MKILIITNHSYMLWRFRKELIQELMKEHEVVLSMPFVGHEDDFQALGIRCIETNVDRRGINPKTDFQLIKTYDKLTKKEQPDLVITYSIKPNIYAGLVCRWRKIPYFANVQGLGTAFQKPGLAEFVTLLYKLVLGRAKGVFFENQANAEEFCKRRIVCADKEIILNGAGINMEQYPYCEYPENETFHFMYLGRIMREKGMDELFWSVKKLHQEGEKFVLDLVGFFEDEYKEQADELEKQGIAVFHGFSTNPKPYYEGADCVVMPSYHEGMSNVLLEAAAIGRPVITSNIPGCREAVEDGRTGLLAEVQNREQLYEAMRRMMKLSRVERQAMGQAGCEKMKKEFDKKTVVAETVKALGLS